MKKGGKIPSFMWETYRAMSVDVAQIIPFMALTSCMNQEEREFLAYIEGLKLILKDSPEAESFIKFLDKWAIPIVQKIGRAKWGRDTVSDLGFAKAIQGEEIEDLSE